MPDNLLQTYNRFSATDSLGGYLYQVLFALVVALEKLIEGKSDFSVCIESLDDIVFMKGENPVELLQTKHHVKSKANLTDRSPDLWKTLRIWASYVHQRQLQPPVALCLITTSSVETGSIASFLSKGKERNVAEAISRLDAISAKRSSNQLDSCFVEYANLSPTEKDDLLSNVYIIPSAPPIHELDSIMERLLRLSCPSDCLEDFVKRLQNWWLGTAMRNIVSNMQRNTSSRTCNNPVEHGISSLSIHRFIDELRASFKEKALHFDETIKNACISLDSYATATFIKQLKLLALKESRLLKAATMFFQASTQRNQWIKNCEVSNEQLQNFDRHLKDAWEIKFEQKMDSIDENSSESEKVQAGKSVYDWAEERIEEFPTESQERFLTVGSYHMLSDKMKVGWHPDFRTKLIPEQKTRNNA